MKGHEIVLSVRVNTASKVVLFVTLLSLLPGVADVPGVFIPHVYTRSDAIESEVEVK